MPPKRPLPILLTTLRARAAAVWNSLQAGNGRPKRGSSRGMDLAGPGSQPGGIEEQLANIVAAAMDAIISVDEKQRIVLFNPAAEYMFGYTADEAIGQCLEILVPQRFRQAHVDHMGRFMKEGTTARRMGSLSLLTGLRANGEEFPIEASISRVSTAGGWRNTAIVRDVSERVQSERQLRSFIDNAPAAIAMFDRNMRYLAASQRWLEDYNLAGSVTGRSHYEVFPDIPKRWKQVYRRVLAGETIKARENFFRRANAPSLWLKWEMRPWYLAQGMIGGVILFTEDITARKIAEKALRASEERFRGVFKHAAIGIAIKDLHGRVLSSNPAYSFLLGYTQDELQAFDFTDLVHPEDRDANREEFRRLVAGEIPSFEIVKRYLAKGSNPIWVHEHVSLQRDLAGKPASLISLVTDITERKRHEEHTALLLREVNHRAKNMLAVVQSVARQTAATKTDDFIARFGERIQALSASHDLLVENAWNGVDIAALIRSQLAHFQGLIGTRIKLKGPPVFLSASAAQAIGMALHELCTNASKYGALSNGDGRAEIGWRFECAEGDEQAFVMSWREEDGPPVMAPARRGFGSTVIERLAKESLDAQIDLDFVVTGLSWCLRCPAKRVLADTAASLHERPVLN